MGRQNGAAVGGDKASSWLEHAPGAWMQQFIKVLSARDQLSLFRTCKAVAKQVLAHVLKVQLWMQHPRGHDSVNVEARRSFITQLLDVGRALEIIQYGRKFQPFPIKLSCRIVELAFRPGPDEGPSTDGFDWMAFTNLQELNWHDNISERDFNRVCEALEVGHLRQLHKLSISFGSQVSRQVLERFVQLLGPQIAHLGWGTKLLPYLKYFTALQSLKVDLRMLTKEMCEHATLRTVTWWTMSKPYKLDDLTHCECNWETLTLDDVRPSCLLSLPLDGLKEIQFLGQLYKDPPAWSDHEEEWQAFRELLSRHGHKIVCVPLLLDSYKRKFHPLYSTPTYCMTQLREEEIMLVSKLRDPCQLHLRARIVQKMSEHYKW